MDIEKTLKYLAENNQSELDTRINKYTKEYEFEIKEVEDKMKLFEYEAKINNLPIDKNFKDYFDFAKKYIYVECKGKLPKLPDIALDSTFIQGSDALSCKTALNNEYNLKEVQDECLVVNQNYDTIPFTSDILKIKEHFNDFDYNKLRSGEFFIYYPQYTLDWMLGFKIRYDDYRKLKREKVSNFDDFKVTVSKIKEELE